MTIEQLAAKMDARFDKVEKGMAKLYERSVRLERKMDAGFQRMEIRQDRLEKNLTEQGKLLKSIGEVVLQDQPA